MCMIEELRDFTSDLIDACFTICCFSTMIFVLSYKVQYSTSTSTLLNQTIHDNRKLEKSRGPTPAVPEGAMVNTITIA